MTDLETQAPGWSALLARGTIGRTLVLGGGVAIHAVSIYVVATILPVVVAEIGGVAFFAWTATLYVAGSLCGAAATPLLLSRAGPRGAYLFGFALFMAGSLICSLAPDMAVLLLGRAVQGVGGGMLPALAYATIRSVFAPRLHARAIALLGTVWGTAALIGPSIGGVFAQYGAWRAAFWVDIPIGLLFAVLATRVVPRAVEGLTARPFPGVRLLLLAAAAIAVSIGGVFGRALPAALGIAAAVLLLALVMRLDRRAGMRLLPSGAFDPLVPIGAVSATIGLFILSSTPCNYIGFFLQTGLGRAPVTGGYMVALIAISWTIASLLAVSFSKQGVRLALFLAPCCILAGMLLHVWSLPIGLLPAIAAGQVLIGIGIGIAWPHLGALVMQVAPAADRDIAGPFLSLTQTLAAAFGSAAAGMVANIAGLPLATTPAAIMATSPWLFGIMAIFALAAILTSWRILVLTRTS